ncbi:hypothetical protein [Fodinibius sp. Rm-B-1B1-1]|uniref:hypothetical protein n=1 Tax=Fodinibius alkaliphilus TaxID=3140241 RepID=UPI00315A8337
MSTNKKLVVIWCLVASIMFMACENPLTGNKDDRKPDLGESLTPIEEMSLIEGAESATLTININGAKKAYFNIEFSNIGSNKIIDNELKDGWCIDVWKSIDSNDGVYTNIKLYSTHLVEQWKPVNYLLNVQQALRNNDPQITWLEIQLVIWSLRAYPEFDLETTSIENLPGQFRKDGKALFSYEKVYEILDFVEANYKSFNFDQNGAKFAVVAEMPIDVQTVITIAEK